MLSRFAVPFFFIASVFAQNLNDGQISGVVFFRDGQPADHIQIHIRGSRGSGLETDVTTDTQGKFVIGGLFRSDVYTLTIDLRGYFPYSNRYDLSMSPRSYDSITLRPRPSEEAPNVPKEGPGATVNARQVQITPEAKAEFDAGQKAMQANDLAVAAAHFQKATELYPRYAEAFQLLGLVQLQLAKQVTDLKKVEESENKAVQLENGLPNAYYILGVARAMMGNTPAAEEPLTTFVAKDPNNPDGHFELAKTEFALNKFPEAELQARKAIELKEKNPGVEVVLAYSLLRQKKGQEAKEAFKQYLKLDPNSPMKADVENTIAKIDEIETQRK